MDASPFHAEFFLHPDVMSVKAFVNSHTVQIHHHGDYAFPDTAHESEDVHTRGPASCDWVIRQASTGFSVFGQMHGTLIMECVRCLSSFDISIAVAVDEDFVLEQYVDNLEKERQLQSDDFFEMLPLNGTLDFKDLAYQLLLIEADQHPYCNRDDCHLAHESSHLSSPSPSPGP